MERSIIIADQTYVVEADSHIPSLPDLSGDDWRDLADDRQSNGLESCYRYALADGLSLYIDVDQGDITAVQVSAEPMLAHMREWWHAVACGEVEEAEWLVEWGMGGLAVLDVAGEDYNGPCRVWHEPCYYQGTCNAPREHFAREDGTDDIRDFATRAEAQSYVDEYYNAPSKYDGIPACNVLSHGQAGADTLTIVKAYW